ncbi:DNA-binding transcriptional LysR family regulator [Friedmanniella endophytica]|uniref:DNA-binding transcriptional LysR family regulator n=1 Tax=Microlunatus kandeliicorticis TaxID=1759536 RepID=A0A7W3IR72_9ACTN|nr:LysR family transcriptional regulator [Microlunatus kandeliicorticis]MBA8793700.1 DNA-binding transcriptional LysR family regulator [Microlunatus kandeliicorticis]
MELRQLEHFVAVAEHQHFTRAADRLQISQSGLSASVRALETELGTPLFTRSTRRVELTPAGQAFLAEAVRTVAAATAAKNAVAAVRGVLGGTLSVGTEQCLGVIDLPAELAAFRREHSQVDVRLGFAGSADLIERLGAGRLDLALVARCGPTPRGVRLRTLFEEGFVLLCRPDHPLAGLPVVDLELVGREQLVGFSPEWAARMLAEQAFAAAGLRPTVGMEVNDVGTLLDLVGHGLGVALVPAHFAEKRPDRLCAVPLDPAAALVWSVTVAVPAEASPAATALLTQMATSRPDRTPVAA